MHSVDGKVIIITGAGAVGKGMALHLGQGGARVVAEWKPHLWKRRSFGALGVEHLGVVCDIQSREQIDAMVARSRRVDAPTDSSQRADVSTDGPIADVLPRTSTCSTRRASRDRCGRCSGIHMKAQQWAALSTASSMGITGGTVSRYKRRRKRYARTRGAREWAATESS